MKDTKTILKEDRVDSTIHNVNRFLRMATNQTKKARCKSDYFVMTGNCVEQVIDKYQNRAARSALVVDDLGMQVINRLVQEGVKTITLALARVPAEWFAFVKNVLAKTFPDMSVSIVPIEETNGMNVDLLISNPPYGKDGADITDKLRVTVTYTEFINLLPANDYKKGTTKETFRYARDMEPVNNGFEGDAAVTTHLASIVTVPDNITYDEFELRQYKDTSLSKYFLANRTKTHYALDEAELSGATDAQFKLFNIDTTVLFGSRDVNHGHLPYSKTTDTYRYNVEKSVDNTYIFEHRKATRGITYDGWLHVAGVTFKTAEEKTNFVNFIYSHNGFRFLAKIFKAVNIDGTINCGKVFPKVDWSREWTVEEILADYGYTEDEIKEVMNDLDNFKDMDRD